MSEWQRRKLLMASGALLAWPLGVHALQSGRIYRIGVLLYTARAEAFRKLGYWPLVISQLASHGYVEGKNLQFDVVSAEGDVDRLPALAAELVKRRPDALVSSTNVPALALQRATRSVPIVILSHAAACVGLVASLARPGGNITGVDTLAPELDAKRLELLKELVPSSSRIAALYNPTGDPGMQIHMTQVESAARALSLSLRSFEFRRADEADGVLAAIANFAPDALITLSDTTVGDLMPRLTAFLLEKRMPSVFEYSDFVTAGGLLSYGPPFAEIFSHVGDYLWRILDGARPADLPVEQPTTFELVVNLKTAARIGLAIPQLLRLRTDRFIE